MRWIGRWVRRLRYFLSREREERDLAEEMDLHLEMEISDLIARGVDPVEARRRARLSFGGVDRYREEVRGARGVLWIDALRQDVIFALRTLRRAPGFAAGALVVLALGIGATTAAFGVLHAVLLKPLPYPDPSQLVRVWPAAPTTGAAHRTFSVPDFRDWRDRSATLSHLALYSTLPSPPVLTGRGPAEEIPSAYVAGDFFGVFGVQPAVGRVPRPDEDREGTNRVLVVSHDYWQRRFGGDPSVVGTVLTLDGLPFELVGVMPPDFAFPSAAIDAWLFVSTIPQGAIPWEQRFVRFLFAVGRLAPGVTPERADQELDAVAAGLAGEFPEVNEQLTAATVESLHDVVVGDSRARLWIVLSAVGLILVIACANVAGLLLARAGTRRAELAVRMSLGAGRGRVMRQLLVESAVLGGLGGVLGCALAWVGTRVVAASGATLLPRSSEIAFDPTALLFAVALTVGSILLVGVLPALRATDVGVARGLATRGTGRGTGGVGVRRVLVAGEVALSVVLLVAAGLLVRSFQALRSVDPGFRPEGLATLTLTLSDTDPDREGEYMPTYRAIMERIAALPGVDAAASIRRLPLRGGGETANFRIPGLFEPSGDEAPTVELVHVGGPAFRVLGVPVREGRTFTPLDDSNAPLRVVVNEAFVRSYIPAGAPLVGRTMRIYGDEEAEVVGIVGDVRHRGLDDPAEPTIYVHQEQTSRVGMAFLARVQPGVDPLGVVGAMRDVVAEVDRDQPVREAVPMTVVLRESLATPRFLTLLLAAAGALAAGLSALGVYGIIATIVRQRRREVGLRMALGAERSEVVRLFVRQGMRPALVGLGAGLVVALLMVGFLDALLFGVEPLDPWAFAAAGAVVLLLAVGASGLPALRAGALEPARVLRED